GNGITWTGFVAGEDTTDLTGAISYLGPSQGAVDIGDYAIESTGFTARNYNINFKSDSLRINPRLLNINYGGGDTITYGDAIDMLNYTPLTTDLAVADTFKLESIGFGNDISSAGHLIVGVHSLTIGDAFILNAAQDTVTHNYIFAFNPPALWVSPKVIAVINALAEDKIYDKSTDAVVSNATLSGVEMGDSIFLHNATSATFANDDAAANITVIPDSVYITGKDSANYILKPLPLLQAEIYKRRLTYVVDTVSDKIYDATDSLINRLSASTSDTILADSITFSFALSFSQKKAGIDWPIADDVWSIAGAEAGNYQLLPYAGDSATISPEALFITANDTVKTYDSYHFYGGNGITWDGFVAGEDTSDLGGALNYVGSSQFALDTGNYAIVPSGFRANNYDITYVSGTLRINSRVLHINYGGADTLRYGEVIDMLDYSPVVLDVAPNDRFYVGSLSFGDKVSSAGLLAVGTHNLTIGDAYILNNGADSVSHNYIFTINPPALFVKEKVLTIINATAQNKVYDNTTEAVVNGAMLEGVIAGDDVILTNSKVGIFADENVGNAVLVSTDSMLLLGVDILNYTLAPQPMLKANIIPRPVLYTLDSVENKVYDGSDSLCNVVRASTNDTIAADSLKFEFLLSFENTRAGDNWTINAPIWKLEGPEKSNYTLGPFVGDSAAIIKADLLFEVADTSRYYGEINPRFEYVVSGFINSEGMGDVDTLPSFSCVQNRKTFVGEYRDAIQLLAGSDDNYNFIVKNGDLTINKVEIDVNYMAEDTLIYGDEVNANDYSVVGKQMVNGDSLHLGALQFGNDTSSSGHYNIGQHVILPGAITAMDEAGVIDCSVNYEITFNPSFIVYVPKPVTVSIEALDKEYDGNASTVLNYKHINDLFMGDDVFLDLNSSDLIGAREHKVLNAVFQNKRVQSGKSVTPVACHFSGIDCHNYDLILPDLKADITPRKIRWFGDALDKVYDGDTNAELDSIGLLRIIEGDDIAVNYTTANFAQSDAGADLAVSLSQISTVGADKSNYDLDEFYDLRATIHKAKLAVKLDDFTYGYGDTLPDPSFTYDGLVNEEDVSVIDIKPQLLSTISSKSDVGYYTLSINEAYDNNYEFTYLPGQVTIVPRPLEITYVGPDKLCANELVDLTAYAADNLALADKLKTLEFVIATQKDERFRSGEKYYIERGTTVIENEAKRKVNDNYTITMPPSEVEILEIPGPDLGDDLEFCGICEYDFDGGEGTSYLWSTGDTTRHISMLGNFRGDVWVRVGNENGCFNTDTVEISVESKYLKDFIIAFIYPNPSNGKFKVKLSQHVTDVAYIYDISGNLIKKIEVDAEEFNVDIFVPDGAYLLEIRDAKEIFLIENSVVIGVE
ncbi:MAG: YDG domain-containing protein, partial [Bacteroidales bacterium]|nr:YDG domain-containing protein [Bacteroidales bacterium]